MELRVVTVALVMIIMIARWSVVMCACAVLEKTKVDLSLVHTVSALNLDQRRPNILA